MTPRNERQRMTSEERATASDEYCQSLLKFKKQMSLERKTLSSHIKKRMSDNRNTKLFEGDMNNTTVPLLLGDKVKCDLTQHLFFMLRLTPEDKYALDDVKTLMSDISTKNIWFVSEEQSKKGVKHYHCVFLVPNTFDPRQDIKDWLLIKFPGTWKKQDGNKRYNLQEVEDIDKAFTYTSKDGDFITREEINPKYIEYVNSKSYQKKDQRIGQLMSARQLYLKGQLNERQLFESVCDVCIKTSATGSLNMTYVKSFMTGAMADKNPNYRDKLFESMKL